MTKNAENQVKKGNKKMITRQIKMEIQHTISYEM